MIYFRWPGRDEWHQGTLPEVFDAIARDPSDEEIGLLEQLEANSQRSAKMLGAMMELLIEKDLIAEAEVYMKLSSHDLIDHEFFTMREPDTMDEPIPATMPDEEFDEGLDFEDDA